MVPNLSRIKLTRSQLSIATKILVGHCLTETHAEILGLTQDRSCTCRRYGESEDTYQQMLCDSPYLELNTKSQVHPSLRISKEQAEPELRILSVCTKPSARTWSETLHGMAHGPTIATYRFTTQVASQELEEKVNFYDPINENLWSKSIVFDVF